MNKVIDNLKKFRRGGINLIDATEQELSKAGYYKLEKGFAKKGDLLDMVKEPVNLWCELDGLRKLDAKNHYILTKKP